MLITRDYWGKAARLQLLQSRLPRLGRVIGASSTLFGGANAETGNVRGLCRRSAVPIRGSCRDICFVDAHFAAVGAKFLRVFADASEHRYDADQNVLVRMDRLSTLRVYL